MLVDDRKVIIPGGDYQIPVVSVMGRGPQGDGFNASQDGNGRITMELVDGDNGDVIDTFSYDTDYHVDIEVVEHANTSTFQLVFKTYKGANVEYTTTPHIPMIKE